MKRIVRFVHNYPPYAAGEVAGFAPAIADDLIKATPPIAEFQNDLAESDEDRKELREQGHRAAERANRAVVQEEVAEAAAEDVKPAGKPERGAGARK